MVSAGRTTLQLPLKVSPFASNDALVFVYGTSTANTANAVAQTALISINNLLSNTANLVVAPTTLIVATQQADPANSTALTVQQGTLFFSNTFGYIAIANNITRRFAISVF